MEILENLKKSGFLILRNIELKHELDLLNKKINSNNLYVLLVPCFVFSLILSIVFYDRADRITISFIKEIVKDNSGNISTMLFFLSMVIFAIIVAFVNKKAKANRRLKNEDKIYNLKKEIEETYNECMKFTILPKDYCNVHAVSKMINYFQNSRAESLKEAINLFETEEVNERKMNLLYQIKAEQEALRRQVNIYGAANSSRGLFS